MSKLLILESAINLKGMMLSFPARQGHQPSWHQRPFQTLAKVSVERYVFAHSLLGQRAPHPHPLCVSHPGIMVQIVIVIKLN